MGETPKEKKKRLRSAAAERSRQRRETTWQDPFTRDISNLKDKENPKGKNKSQDEHPE